MDGARAIDCRPARVSSCGGSRNSEDLCQIADGIVAGGVHAAEFPLLLLGELRLFAPQLTLGPGDGHPFPRAHSNEIGLELGKGGQDVEKHLAHRVAGVMDISAQGELQPLGLQLIRDMPGIGNRSRQAVQLRHHQGVTLAHCGHGLIQAGPGAVGAGQTLAHVDAIRCDAELGECLPLRRQVLLVRGTTGVADGLLSSAGVSVRGGFIVTSRRRVEVPENGPDMCIICMVRLNLQERDLLRTSNRW